MKIEELTLSATSPSRVICFIISLVLSSRTLLAHGWKIVSRSWYGRSVIWRAIGVTSR